MNSFHTNISRRFRRLMLMTLLGSFLTGHFACAHPMPNSIVLLDVRPDKVFAELQLPLNELELAFGHQVNQNPAKLVERLGPELKKYIITHILPVTDNGSAWTVTVDQLEVQQVRQSPSGPYHELMVKLWMIPPKGTTTRDFTLNYDVILHQVATHFALVSVRRDWEAGLYGENPVQLGVIDWDIRNNVIHPLKVSLKGGGEWNGFKQTVLLGMHHIAEGTDHLLFLLVLLLPAPLLVDRKRWSTYGGIRYSSVRLLKIVTSFTIGHSVTLIVGALGWFSFPGQTVEIIIAFSIIVSAIHALWPIFSGKEAYVAAGFGLVHGMAFAGTLLNLNLDTFHLGLSILVFNAGIELMQLAIILLIFPWLLILSRQSAYQFIRVPGSVLSAVAAMGWMLERITENPNGVTSLTNRLLAYAPWFVAFLALASLLSILKKRTAKVQII